MNPGKLSKRVKVIRLTKQSDNAGGILDDFETEDGWELVKETWAGIRPASASARTIAQQRMSEITHEVLVRYDANIQEDDVIKYKDRRLDIITIINLQEENRYMKIECLERRND